MTTLEKIRAEIDEQTEIHSDGKLYIKNIDVKRILAKYAEQSGWEEMTVPCKHCGKDMTFKIATIGEPCEDCKYKSMAEQEPLTEEDYKELHDRFGDYVEFVVRDMVSGKGERW